MSSLDCEQHDGCGVESRHAYSSKGRAGRRPDDVGSIPTSLTAWAREPE